MGVSASRLARRSEGNGVHEMTVSSTQDAAGIQSRSQRRFQSILSNQIPSKNQMKHKGSVNCRRVFRMVVTTMSRIHFKSFATSLVLNAQILISHSPLPPVPIPSSFCIRHSSFVIRHAFRGRGRGRATENIEHRTSNIEIRGMTKRPHAPHFIIRSSLFDIRYSSLRQHPEAPHRNPHALSRTSKLPGARVSYSPDFPAAHAVDGLGEWSSTHSRSSLRAALRTPFQ